MQLAALALPAHPFAFARVEHTATVEQHEARAAGGGLVSVVQCRDRFGGDRKQTRIACEHFLIRVESIREQGKRQIAAGAREVMHFEAFDLPAQIGLARQQHRHGDQGAQRRGHAAAQIEARQPDRAETPRHEAIDQCGRDRGSGNERASGEEDEEPHLDVARCRGPHGPERQREQERGDAGDFADVTGDTRRILNRARRKRGRTRKPIAISSARRPSAIK